MAKEIEESSSTQLETGAAETAEREELKPKGICCPEGVWVCEAWYRLGRTLRHPTSRHHKAIDLAQKMIEDLINNPEIEVFTICSDSGKKEPIDRNFLRSKRAANCFAVGLIPYFGEPANLKNRDGRYIFINKTHYESYLKGLPIISGPKSQEKVPEVMDRQKDKSLGTRERETLLKIILGMAIKGYSYDPKASKNSAIGEIRDDLELLGISVTDDTIRKWLKEAAEYLPREA